MTTVEDVPQDDSGSDRLVPDRAVPESMRQWIDAEPKRVAAEKSYLDACEAILEQAQKDIQRDFPQDLGDMAAALSMRFSPEEICRQVSNRRLGCSPTCERPMKRWLPRRTSW